MNAATLDEISNGRLILGIGTSGKRVIEGFHGRAFDKPLTQVRDVIRVVRTLLAGDRLSGSGAELPTLVQVRTRRSLNDVWQDLISGREPKADAKLLYVAPGRVNAAQATILALSSQTYQEFYAVMWLSLQSRRSGAGNAPPPPLVD